MSERDGKSYAKWESATEGPLLVLALVFLVAYATPIVLPDASLGVRRLARWVEWLTWVLFAVDYVVRLSLAPDRRRFVRTHLVDLAAVALPMFRAMRLLRLLSIIALLTKRDGGRRRATAATVNVGSFALLLIIVSSLAVLEAERTAPKAQIVTFGDSLWWSITTMTTVGYGDVVPTTATGRIVGVVVMLTGIAVLGVVTANVSSWFVAGFQRPDGTTDAVPDGTPTHDELRAQIAELTEQLALARGGAAPTASDGPATQT
ncbi:potassium channel family protein [Nocardioides sp. YIM 152588]|uniref:potassium channel family protein n=1 Tax=Nocardioides sp. YIM 152588 TaxID=3158259 RepID=UPI0032E371C2